MFEENIASQKEETIILASKLRDYTAMPVGKGTKQGIIAVCKRCGKRGAYVKVRIPQGYIEKWLHSQQASFFTNNGPTTSCIRSEIIVDGKTMNGWGWSDRSKN